ncbi:hypothetical protein ABIC65_001870 [Sphingomonas trueperi]
MVEDTPTPAVIPAKAGIQSPLRLSKSRDGDPNGSRLSPG